MNKIYIKGGLTRDPRLGESKKSGVPYAFLSVACTSRIKSKEGFNEETVYFNVTAWDKQAERCKVLKKGSQIFVIGRVKPPEEYISKDSEEKLTYSLYLEEMYFLGEQGYQRNEQRSTAQEDTPAPQRRPLQQQKPQQRPPMRDEIKYEDDLPF